MLKRARWILGGVAALLALIALDLAFPPPLERGDALAQVVTDRAGRPLRAFAAEGGVWRLGADLDRIDPAFLEALIAIEDERFYAHPGVDPIAVVRAGASALGAGRIVSGASTITMQTARLLEPRPRTLGSKLIEMIRALQIERRLSKRQILELYLTLTPYGGNLEGVRAASWAYFGREPEALAPEEIALLIALPQAPEARRPDRRPAAAVAARNRILARMADLGRLDPARAAEAASLPAPPRRDFPALAWHGAAAARAAAGPEVGEDVRATLDAGLDADLEALARAAAIEAGPAAQVAILVADARTRAVRASIGSVGRASRPGGWIDLTDRPRSPGSALKPFVYALAFDDGIARPDTRIEDLPRRFGLYRPENFDRAFRGEVTLADALAHSLNVPAVLALDRIGPARFAAALTAAGAPVRVDLGAEQAAGLALALGGAGVTMRELATLYAALADDGIAKPLAWTEAEAARRPGEDGVRFTSPETAADILRILADTPAPAGFLPPALAADAPRIAFKTGTSYGFRDAWAAGVANDLVVIVWVGRADGGPRPGATGREAALPLLFRAIDRAVIRLDRARDRPPVAGHPDRLAAAALDRFEAAGPPRIVFPPDGADLAPPALGPGARGFVLSGRGAGALAWYVDGRPAARDAVGNPVWRPETAGFYTVEAVDPKGRTTSVRVRVLDPAF